MLCKVTHSTCALASTRSIMHLPVLYKDQKTCLLQYYRTADPPLVTQLLWIKIYVLTCGKGSSMANGFASTGPPSMFQP